jgi:hypothetical protein
MYRLKNYDDKTGAVACFKEAYADKASHYLIMHTLM